MQATRITVMLVVMLAGGAAAHETYFAPVPPARVGVPLTLALSSGMAFPKLDTGPKASRVVHMSAKTGSVALPVTVSGESANALHLALTPDRAGMLVVTVDLAPHPIELGAAKVSEYFADVDPDSSVRAAYAAQPAPRTWRELYAKHAKVLICVAPCIDVTAATEPSNQALEFVVQNSNLRRFVLLENGKPRGGQPVELLGAGAPQHLRTDSGGALVLPDSAKGDLLLSTTVIRPPAQNGAPFTSDFATLTFRAR